MLYSLPFSSWKSVGALEPWEGTRTPQLSPTWRLPTQKNTTLSMLASVLPMQACESYGWWMKPHLFVKGKAITLKSTVSLSNTQSTSRTIATQSKRWEAPHAPVCPTDTQHCGLRKPWNISIGRKRNNNMQCPNPPSNVLSGPPFKELCKRNPSGNPSVCKFSLLTLFFCLL